MDDWHFIEGKCFYYFQWGRTLKAANHYCGTHNSSLTDRVGTALKKWLSPSPAVDEFWVKSWNVQVKKDTCRYYTREIKGWSRKTQTCVTKLPFICVKPAIDLDKFKTVVEEAVTENSDDLNLDENLQPVSEQELQQRSNDANIVDVDFSDTAPKMNTDYKLALPDQSWLPFSTPVNNLLRQLTAAIFSDRETNPSLTYQSMSYSNQQTPYSDSLTAFIDALFSWADDGTTTAKTVIEKGVQFSRSGATVDRELVDTIGDVLALIYNDDENFKAATSMMGNDPTVTSSATEAMVLMQINQGFLKSFRDIFNSLRMLVEGTDGSDGLIYANIKEQFDDFSITVLKVRE